MCFGNVKDGILVSAPRHSGYFIAPAQGPEPINTFQIYDIQK